MYRNPDYEPGIDYDYPTRKMRNRCLGWGGAFLLSAGIWYGVIKLVIFLVHLF